MPITLSIDTPFATLRQPCNVPIARRDRLSPSCTSTEEGCYTAIATICQSPYRNLLLDAGYTLYCLDYPLAPEGNARSDTRKPRGNAAAGLPNGK